MIPKMLYKIKHEKDVLNVKIKRRLQDPLI